MTTPTITNGETNWEAAPGWVATCKTVRWQAGRPGRSTPRKPYFIRNAEEGPPRRRPKFLLLGQLFARLEASAGAQRHGKKGAKTQRISLKESGRGSLVREVSKAEETLRANSPKWLPSFDWPNPAMASCRSRPNM